MFVMAQLQVRYAKMAEFYEIMPALLPHMETRGMKLVGAWQTRIGPLWEIFDLFEVADANTAISGAGIFGDEPPEFLEAAARLPEVAVSERLRMLETTPYSPEHLAFRGGPSLFVMAQLQVQYAKIAEFYEIMPALLPQAEKHGMTLAGAWHTRIGPLWEIFDLFEVADANTAMNAAGIFGDEPPEFLEAAARLPEVAASEQLRLLEKAPYSP